MALISRRSILELGASALTNPMLSGSHGGYVSPEEFGAYGDGISDDSKAIEQADLAAASLEVSVLLRGQYRVEGQLKMSASWHFEGGEIIRDWFDSHSTAEKDKSATITGRNNDSYASFYTNKGSYSPVSLLSNLSMTGNGTVRMSDRARKYYDQNPNSHSTNLYMLCNDFRIGDGMRFSLGGNDWCIVYGGSGFVGEPFSIFSQSSKSSGIYEDGFHVLFGDGGRGWDWSIESGDDSIAFANNLNLPISDWRIFDPYVFSRMAFGIKIASQRLGATSKFEKVTNALENIHIVRPRWWLRHGERSRNGYVRFDASGEKPGIVRNCSVTGGLFAGSNNRLPKGFLSGVAALSFSGPTTDCLVEAEVRHPSLWTVLMTASQNGLGPLRSRMHVRCQDEPNWVGAKGIRAVDLRGAGEGSWVSGSIVGH
ncbi:MAG: hypothetical protein AAGA97_01205 [Pseudomonadota bacterium]